MVRCVAPMTLGMVVLFRVESVSEVEGPVSLR